MRVAVVGAGLAGLMAARQLAAGGCEVRVFEHESCSGGRAASHPAGFDHGAQFFTLRSPQGRRWLEEWQGQGWLQSWRASFGHVQAQGLIVPESPPDPRWVAVPAMGALAARLAEGLDIQFNATVTELGSDASGCWLRAGPDGRLFAFDAVLLALPPAAALALLPSAALPLRNHLAAVQMLPCWALMLEFSTRVPLDFDALRFAAGPLGWAARDSSKPGRAPGERWLLHAANDWSGRHAAPVPIEVAIIEAFRALIGPQADIVSSRLHRWPMALAARSLGSAALWDAAMRLGCCGDWCADGRLEGALLSGAAAARLVVSSAEL